MCKYEGLELINTFWLGLATDLNKEIQIHQQDNEPQAILYRH